MPKCGCANNTTCTCTVVAGAGTTVTGTGSGGSPYVISSTGGGGGSGTITSVNSDTGPAVSLNLDEIPDGTSYVRMTPAERASIASGGGGGGTSGRIDSGGVQTYRDVFSFYDSVTSSLSSMCIETNLSVGASSMIKGVINIGNLTAKNEIRGEFTVYLYATGPVIHMPTWVMTGTDGVSLRMAKNGAGKLVLILDSPAAWEYPRVSIPEVQVGYGDPGPAAFTGWTYSLKTPAQVTTAYGATIVAMNRQRLIAQELDVLNTALHTTDGVAIYTAGAYPTRASITTDTGRRVRWAGATAPGIGGAYAISGLDVWEKTS